MKEAYINNQPYPIKEGETMLSFIKRHKGDCYTSSEQNQHIESNKCGWFCLAIINSCIGDRKMSYQHYMDVLYNMPQPYNEYVIFCLI